MEGTPGPADDGSVLAAALGYQSRLSARGRRIQSDRLDVAGQPDNLNGLWGAHALLQLREPHGCWPRWRSLDVVAFDARCRSRNICWRSAPTGWSWRGGAPGWRWRVLGGGTGGGRAGGGLHP